MKTSDWNRKFLSFTSLTSKWGSVYFSSRPPEHSEKIDNNGSFWPSGRTRSPSFTSEKDPCSTPQRIHHQGSAGPTHWTASFPFKDFSCFPSPFFFYFLFMSSDRIRGSIRKIFVVPKLETGLSHFSPPVWAGSDSELNLDSWSGPAEIRRTGLNKEQVVTDEDINPEHLLQTDKNICNLFLIK